MVSSGMQFAGDGFTAPPFSPSRANVRPSKMKNLHELQSKFRVATLRRCSYIPLFITTRSAKEHHGNRKGRP